MCATVTFVSSNVNATTETKPQNDVRPSTRTLAHQHTRTHTRTPAQKWRTNEITARAHFCSMSGGFASFAYAWATFDLSFAFVLATFLRQVLFLLVFLAAGLSPYRSLLAGVVMAKIRYCTHRPH
ncbi:hypothetical protein M5D96_002368 [Drosophila gunungcola]|uniref:Uncharacterized protein n=1 Tax=Drosophila gunungcola TaxID=103775 RepID=A0A9P9Z0C1_9MUSC|nr:hypothetical protein M5D96_002368 [Drosophila gunungcola]